ncbi:hypothetical protein RMSM_04782 [Rhodopirellula maiorica SM1]|uniref:Uncharacterized protein n=1 Tax=Rhodopirellula maiorica SM1 TaxID=1265738 RepID=M5RSF8_9BACT|nr:class I SAM-dependent methyltransferase [Rhodopirellula maiorica]EMI18302.1 hypothetical protein RMSM_04782 [Rhodopirellula maiorica SM1]
MTLDPIAIPKSIKANPLSPRQIDLIDQTHDRIEAFMLADSAVIETFVPCDFQWLSQCLDWIKQQHMASGKRFCELGSGFGAAAMLAAMQGMTAVGIEIEPDLVAHSNRLAADLGINAQFYCGNFVPSSMAGSLASSREADHIATGGNDAYEAIGIAFNEFDLFFAFPWPGEHEFYKTLVDTCAAPGAMLLTYNERAGMKLFRKP